MSFVLCVSFIVIMVMSSNCDSMEDAIKCFIKTYPMTTVHKQSYGIWGSFALSRTVSVITISSQWPMTIGRTIKFTYIDRCHRCYSYQSMNHNDKNIWTALTPIPPELCDTLCIFINTDPANKQKTSRLILKCVK